VAATLGRVDTVTWNTWRQALGLTTPRGPRPGACPGMAGSDKGVVMAIGMADLAGLIR